MVEPKYTLGLKLDPKEFDRFNRWRRRQTAVPSVSAGVRALMRVALDVIEEEEKNNVRHRQRP